MGMWEGLYTGLQNIRAREEREMDREEARRVRAEDVAFRREQFERGILEQRRNAMLPILLERQKEAKAIQDAINGAVSLGFDRPAAEALQRSGQLGFVMRSLESQDFSKERISAMSSEVMRQLGDRASQDTVAAALIGVVESGADLNNPRETELAIVESVLNAESIEELEGLYGRVASVGDDRPGMSRFDISVGTAGVDTTEGRRIRNGIMERLQGTYGSNIITLNESGDYTFAANPPAALVNVVNSLTDAAVDAVRTPGPNSMDAVTAIQYFTNPITQAYQAGITDVGQVSENLSTLYQAGPETFLETLSTIQMPSIPTPGANPMGDAMTAISGGSSQAGGVRSPTPLTGFGFDVDEELKR
jgi:hypothetical protein